MDHYHCPTCDNLVFFENTHCEGCLNPFAFEPSSLEVAAMPDKASSTQVCSNASYGVCNWTDTFSPVDGLCLACALNNTVSDPAEKENVDLWRPTERAKHRLVYALLRFPNDEFAKALFERRLTFDFLVPADENTPVMTGHKDGLITLNLLEANDAYRETVRSKMGEPYRTLLGHFRHEVGHFYWQELVATRPPRLNLFRKLFGDDRASYQDALTHHYKEGPSPDWRLSHISAYASVHPWEDWAETWAYYLHMVDALDTANSFGLGLKTRNRDAHEPVVAGDPFADTPFEEMIERWKPLSVAVNSLNRSLGTRDPSPFVLSAKVEEKLRFVHNLVRTPPTTPRAQSQSQSQSTTDSAAGS